jgi:hypothetical protein
MEMEPASDCNLLCQALAQAVTMLHDAQEQNKLLQAQLAQALVKIKQLKLTKKKKLEEAGVTPQQEEAGVTPQQEEAGVTPQQEEAGVTPQQEEARVTPQQEEARVTPQPTAPMQGSSLGASAASAATRGTQRRSVLPALIRRPKSEITPLSALPQATPPPTLQANTTLQANPPPPPQATPPPTLQANAGL